MSINLLPFTQFCVYEVLALIVEASPRVRHSKVIHGSNMIRLFLHLTTFLYNLLHTGLEIFLQVLFNRLMFAVNRLKIRIQDPLRGGSAMLIFFKSLLSQGIFKADKKACVFWRPSPGSSFWAYNISTVTKLFFVSLQDFCL